jgi:integrase
LATINAACSAIGHQHRLLGLPDPIDHDLVRRVRRGLRRLLGASLRRPARPLSVADLRQIIAAIDSHTPAGRRDAAIILLGFAGALRRSELAALTLADLEPKPGGLLLHLHRSKTDPYAWARWSASPRASIR